MDEEVEIEDVVAANEFRARFRRLVAESETKIRSHGLTPQQYQLLLAVKGAPDRSESLSVGEVAGALLVAQSSATELIDRAERRGLVRRAQAPTDARSSRIHLTAEGEQLFAACFRAVGQERRQLFDAVSAMEAALRHGDALRSAPGLSSPGDDS